jgi:hypothetical protein
MTDPTSSYPGPGGQEPTSPPPPAGPPAAGSPPAGPPPAGPPPAAPPYGNAPSYAPAPAYGAPPAQAPADPPPPLALAVRLMYAGAVLSLLTIAVTVLQRDTIRSQITEQGRLSGDAVDAAVTATLILGAVVALIGAGLWVLNAVYNARGRMWARVLSTVLGATAVLFAVASLTQPASGLSRALTFVQLLLAAAILLLIWRPVSSQYYRARSETPGR